MRSSVVLLVVVLGLTPVAVAQDESPSLKLVIAGGGALPESVFKAFRELAGPQPSLVVVPTASERELNVTEVQLLWRTRGFDDVRVMHTNDRKVASSADFVAPLKRATAVWFGGGSQQRIADAYLNTPVEKELYRLLQRGAVIGGSSAGAAIQSRVMIASGRTDPKLSTGFDFLPGAIVDQHFLKRNRIPRLLAAVRANPNLIGFGIDEGTALVVDGENARVLGKSFVLRVESVQSKIKVDALDQGDLLLLAQPASIAE